MPTAKTDLLSVEIRPGWHLSSERTLYLAPEKILVLADIHWGYAESHRRIGNLLPHWGDAEIALRLTRLLDHFQPSRMIWLGDSLHTPRSAGAAERFLSRLDPSLDIIVIAGNHDRSWSRADRQEFRLGSYFFHHGDRPRVAEPGLIEVMGHIHPAVSLSDGAGLRLKLPALVDGPKRIILPSFSEWSSGAPWSQILEQGDKLWAISKRKIWAMHPKS